MKEQQRISYVCHSGMAAALVFFTCAAGTAYTGENAGETPVVKTEKQKQERKKEQ